MSAAPAVLVLAGPTASGKTSLAIDLALRFGAEIVNADSRQLYRGMEIGTAAPTQAQQQIVPHHLFGFLDPRERYSAARFAEDATATVQEIQRRGKRAIVCGGTGFYVRALTGAIALAPQYDEALRSRLAREAQLHDANFLHEWLRVHDRRRAEAIHPGDAYRVLRALEVALAPAHSTLRQSALTSLVSAGIPFFKVFLDIEQTELDRRIAARTGIMFEHGFLEEAERIGPDAVAANAVGYPQALAYNRGWSTLDELRSTLVRATRRYAKRQQTWFRSEPQTMWLPADAVKRAARESLGWV